MNLSEFYQEFSSSEKSIRLFRQKVESKGVKCTKCGSQLLMWNPNFIGWRCKKCRKRMSLKSMTFMKHSHVSLKNWLEVIYLLSDFKKSPSIAEIHRQSRVKRYETVYYMVQKIRQEMGVILQRKKYGKFITLDLVLKTNPITMDLCDVYYDRYKTTEPSYIKLEISCYKWSKASELVVQRRDSEKYRFTKILYTNYGKPLLKPLTKGDDWYLKISANFGKQTWLIILKRL